MFEKLHSLLPDKALCTCCHELREYTIHMSTICDKKSEPPVDVHVPMAFCRTCGCLCDVKELDKLNNITTENKRRCMNGLITTSELSLLFLLCGASVHECSTKSGVPEEKIVSYLSGELPDRDDSACLQYTLHILKGGSGLDEN